MLIALAVVAVIIVAILLLATSKSNDFRYERSVNVNASAEKIFPYVNDFHQWTHWSPWEHMDADLQRTYSGSERGKGAIYEWLGKKTGQGRMEITQTTDPRRVVIDLDFLKPFKAHNTADFSIEPSGSGSRVVWAMYGARPFISKLMEVFVNMDNMIGKDFERGLANLKAAAERTV